MVYCGIDIGTDALSQVNTQVIISSRDLVDYTEAVCLENTRIRGSSRLTCVFDDTDRLEFYGPLDVHVEASYEETGHIRPA